MIDQIIDSHAPRQQVKYGGDSSTLALYSSSNGGV